MFAEGDGDWAYLYSLGGMEGGNLGFQTLLWVFTHGKVGKKDYRDGGHMSVYTGVPVTTMSSARSWVPTLGRALCIHQLIKSSRLPPKRILPPPLERWGACTEAQRGLAAPPGACSQSWQRQASNSVRSRMARALLHFAPGGLRS